MNNNINNNKIIPDIGNFITGKENNNIENNNDGQRIQYNGYIIYCLEHDDGCILELNNYHDEEEDDAVSYAVNYIDANYDKLTKAICGVIHNNNNNNNNGRICNLVFHGFSSGKKIMCYENQKYYDMCAGGWKIEYYLNCIVKQSDI